METKGGVYAFQELQANFHTLEKETSLGFARVLQQTVAIKSKNGGNEEVEKLALEINGLKSLVENLHMNTKNSLLRTVEELKHQEAQLAELADQMKLEQSKRAEIARQLEELRKARDEFPVQPLTETLDPNSVQGQQKRAAVYDNVDMTRRHEIKSHPKTEEITNLLINVVQQNILFRNFKSEEHIKIVDAFEFISAKAGEIIIKQGDSGEYFYIVESGQLDVYVESSGVRVKVGRTLSHGDYFGELALMYNTPRAATVISLENSNLWRIDRQTYRTIVTHHNKETSDEFFGLVSNVHILGKRLGDVLSHAELSKVVSTLEVEEFENASVIIRQHQVGDYFYIISEGQVDVWHETVDDKGTRNLKGNKLATLNRGDYFGEKALLADDVRQASCIAVGKVVCLSLSRDDFIAMIGSWQDILHVDHLQSLAAKKAKIRQSVYDSQYHVSLHLEDIEQLNTLGVGAFGRVRVARHKSTAQLYALKAQSKAFIVNQNMQEMILNEMNIMKQIDHPFISKLHASIQDRKYIYFLLELLPGGEFFSFLQTAGKLSEDKSRFYSASVVLALEELHKNKIAYRDLKPENMVMDGRGYVKLVDFGLAKQILSGSTWTMCGTPDYLAPEIILNKGHNHAVDYWALGVLIFEMLHGWPPFYHDQPMKVYEKIILGKVDFPPSFSKALEDIVAKFLVTNPSKRLGNMKGGIADIFKHKWFGSFDWQSLLAGTLPAPHLPDLARFDSAVAAGADDEDEMEEPEDCDWEPPLF